MTFIPNPRVEYVLDTPPPDHPLPIQLPLTFLELGYLTITPGALALLDECSADYESVIDRFRNGDWGTLDPEDARTNERALDNGDRLMGVYLLHNHRRHCAEPIWVICVPYDHTTLLLPEDY